MVVAVAPRLNDMGRLGLRPGPEQSLTDEPHSIILQDVGLTKCISGTYSHVEGSWPKCPPREPLLLPDGLS